jgi:hypothetical protein
MAISELSKWNKGLKFMVYGFSDELIRIKFVKILLVFLEGFKCQVKFWKQQKSRVKQKEV